MINRIAIGSPAFSRKPAQDKTTPHPSYTLLTGCIEEPQHSNQWNDLDGNRVLFSQCRTNKRTRQPDSSIHEPATLAEPGPSSVVRPLPMPRVMSTNHRTRTFTGCRTCRTRHSKCDDAQPICGSCKRLGLTCQGYEPRLFWLTDEASRKQEHQASHRSSLYRFPLSSGECALPHGSCLAVYDAVC
jgi:hypothetical protein